MKWWFQCYSSLSNSFQNCALTVAKREPRSNDILFYYRYIFVN